MRLTCAVPRRKTAARRMGAQLSPVGTTGARPRRAHSAASFMRSLLLLVALSSCVSLAASACSSSPDARPADVDGGSPDAPGPSTVDAARDAAGDAETATEANGEGGT